MIPVKVEKISYHPSSRSYAVILRDDTSDLFLPILVGSFEAQSIALAIEVEEGDCNGGDEVAEEAAWDLTPFSIAIAICYAARWQGPRLVGGRVMGSDRACYYTSELQSIPSPTTSAMFKTI